MARAEDPTARAQRLIPLATVGALAFATALAFGRVFEGRGPTLRLIAAGLMAVTIGWATSRRGLLLATLASAAGLALALTWLVFPQTAWYGLPSPRTLRAVGRSLEFVGQQTRTQISPSPPLPPLMMAAVTAVWAASSSAYTLAMRAGSPILAVLPPVALVAFADIVLEDGVRAIYAGVFLLASLAVVFTDGLRRIRQWGPVWSGPHRDHTLRSTTGRGVRRMALVAVGAALLVPGLLPGFRSEALVDLSGAGSDAVRLDPFVSIHAALNRDEPVDLLRVTTDGAGAYWRVYALDRFDGTGWTLAEEALTDAPEFPNPARLPVSFPSDAEVLEQRFEVLHDFADRFVPMAFPAEVLTLPTDGARYDGVLGTAIAPEPLEEGDSYRVTSRRVLPTPKQLEAVSFGAPTEYGEYTFLPESVPPEVADIALEWTQDAESAYRKVLAIQDHLLDTTVFEYEVLEEETENDPSTIVEFLTVTRKGFCQQFAVSMAVLVRELGIPARLAVGYKEGSSVGGSFVVATDDAHVWVEVLFPGYGWLAFEPTPGSASPLAEPGTYLNPVAPAGEGQDQGEQGGIDGGIGPDSGLPPKIAGMERAEARRSGPIDLSGVTPAPSPVPAEPGYAIPYGLLLAIVLVALGALLVVVPIAKGAWRYRALHRRREPREAVLAAYRVFDGEAADLGLGRADGETLMEYRDRIGSKVRFSDGHLTALTGAAMRAAYSADPVAREDAQEAAHAAQTAIRDMRRNTALVRRLTGVYRPGV